MTPHKSPVCAMVGSTWTDRETGRSMERVPIVISRALGSYFMGTPTPFSAGGVDDAEPDVLPLLECAIYYPTRCHACELGHHVHVEWLA